MVSSVRHLLRTNRRALSSAFIQTASQIISEKINASSEFLNSRSIAYYLSHENEVDLSAVATQAALLKKTCYLPILNMNQQLDFYRVDHNTQYEKNQWGILEPVVVAPSVNVEDIDLFLVPLVAFDAHCHRLGRGKGYYDRTLAYRRNTTLCMGVAYEFQKIDAITPEKWDVPMDCVVTEANCYRRRDS